MNLTKNFTLHEFTYSITAEYNRLDNTPNETVIQNLRLLCQKVLQPLRDYIKSPVKITSGYRSKILNTKLNGAKKSQHLTGQAADFIVPNMKDAFNYIKNNLEYDQLLFEHNLNNANWIHVSYSNNKNRKQAIENYKVK